MSILRSLKTQKISLFRETLGRFHQSSEQILGVPLEDFAELPLELKAKVEVSIGRLR